jgi:two-component system, LuxR family, sensor kinase FixL
VTVWTNGVPMFDWRALQRWGIGESRLPPGSIVQYRQVTFWGQYRWRIVGVLGFCGLQTALIIGLVANAMARKRAELELQQQREQLAHLSRVTMLGELSGSLAHELNQPLTAILSNAQAAQRFLTQDTPDLAELRDILTDIVAEDKRAGEVIRRLRLLLKKSEFQHQPLDLNDVVREVLKLVRNDLVNQGVSVQMELTSDPPAISGDRVQLQQVVINMVMNACHALTEAAPAERVIVLRTITSGGEGVRVEIADRGGGIPPENLERIFEPFFTTRREGLGLGLAVCRTIIGAHGGKIGARNNAERGATFYFTIPAQSEPQP